jgi:hypothetical protein
MPLPGYELISYTRKVNLPPAEAALMHIVNEAEVKRQVQAGVFATAYGCEDGTDIERYDFKNRYKQELKLDDCTLFWDLKK